MKNYTIENFSNDILILLSNEDISDSEKIKSIKMFIQLQKQMSSKKKIKKSCENCDNYNPMDAESGFCDKHGKVVDWNGNC